MVAFFPGHLETAALHHFRIQKAGGIQPFLVTGPPRALVAEAAAVIRTHAVRKLANDQHMFLLNINPLGSQHLPGGFPGDGPELCTLISLMGLST